MLGSKHSRKAAEAKVALTKDDTFWVIRDHAMTTWCKHRVQEMSEERAKRVMGVEHLVGFPLKDDASSEVAVTSLDAGALGFGGVWHGQRDEEGDAYRDCEFREERFCREGSGEGHHDFVFGHDSGRRG